MTGKTRDTRLTRMSVHKLVARSGGNDRGTFRVTFPTNLRANLRGNQGAMIIGVYLLGMTTIAGGAYAFRDTLFNIPVASTDITDTLPLPTDQGVDDVPRLSTIDRLDNTTPEAPRMARLNPTGTLLEDGLFSPLSRIFLGSPAVTPPDRPGLSLPEVPDVAEDDTTPEDEAEAVVAGLGVSARPRLRPEDLARNAAIDDAVRLASLSAPDTLPESLTDPQADIVPETPRIAAPSARCPKRLAREMPRRRGGASGASSVLASAQSIDGVKRDQIVVAELLKGNMPSFQRNLVPVTLRGTTSDGRQANITLCVTPDYLALGSDRDFVRVPLGLSGASRVAKSFNMVLPTPRMVDAIYRQAQVRLTPSPMTPGPQMTSTAYFMRHNDTVEAQRRNAGATHGNLISGHKKDVVLTTRLASNRGRVAIYGWHRRNGSPIQPLSTVHGAGYADYSHGVRLVSRTAYLDGQEVDLHQIMANPRYAGIISHEGPMGRSVLASN
ncbi:MAG: hypothetical protein AAF382_09210 [Pseudomonadota bacterium]